MKLIRKNGFPLALDDRNFQSAVSGFFDRVFGRDYFSTELAAGDFNPRVDVIEKADSVVVKADLPGIEEKDLSVEVKNGVLTLSGRKESEKETRKGDYYSLERSSGSFCRSIALPEDADSEKISAEYRKGVLTVNVPRSGKGEAKKLKVKVS